MIDHGSQRRLMAIALAIAGMASARTQAQVYEEIIVTAQRREESIQDTPVSVTALSGEQLAAFGMRSTMDIAAQAPGVIMTQSSGGSLNALLTIRGVTQADYAPSQEAPNAVYVDEIYYSSPNALNFGLFDLGRVEVLRGPQGTLYGRNSTGGLMSVVSAKPTSDRAAFADLTLGDYEQVRFEGMVNGAITERMNGRLAVLADYHDGYVENVLPGDNDSFAKKLQAARGSLTYSTDDFDALFVLSWSRMPRHRSGAYQHTPAVFTDEGLGADNPAYPSDPTATDFAGGRDPWPDPHKGEFSDVNWLTNEMVSPTLKLSWKIGDMTLTSLSNYQSFEFDYSDDDDGVALPITQYEMGQDLRQWSQEFRLSGKNGAFDWTAGVFYLDIGTKNYNHYWLPDPDVFVPILGTPIEFNANSKFTVDTSSWAAFAQTDYEFTPELSLTIGARYTHDTKDGTAQTFYTEPDYGLVYDFTPASAGDLTRISEGKYSAKIQLNWRPMDDVLGYAGVTRGYKSGGFNAPLDGSVSPEDTPYGSEVLTSYEAGAKVTLLDGHARINGAAFYYDYQDYQAYDLTGLTSIIRNFDAEIYGGELEVYAVPIEGLDVGIGVSLLHGKVFDVPAGADPETQAPIIRDRTMPHAPEFSMNWLVRKAWPIGTNQFSVQVDGNHMAERESGVSNSPAVHMDAYTLWNARLAYTFGDGRYEAAAFGSNLTDENVQIYGYDQAAYFGYNIAVYGPPRLIGVQFRVNMK
jgi:iron complex outermembrane receptor protein